MKSRRLLAATAAVFLTQVQSAKSAEPDALAVHEYIVDARAEQTSGFTYPGQWTPNLDQALEAKHAVKPAKGYYIQYIGAMYKQTKDGFLPDRTGDPVIVVNGFCDGDSRNPAELTRSEVDVMDGGRCYFKALYRLRDRKVLWFAWNGVG